MNYVHGGDIYTLRQAFEGPVLDFSANVNPLGMPSGVRRAAKLAVNEAVHYPDPLCRELKRAVAEHEGVRPGQVVCGNGAADLIFRLVLAKRPKKAVLPVPCFAEYEAALNTVDCEMAYETLSEEKGFALTEGFLTRLGPETDMVFLCDPNNPTGKTVEPSLLDAVVRHCEARGILLVLDRCFGDFLDSPPEKGCAFPSNVFVLKAFTKLYAMAGLRLGYGLCGDPALLERMEGACQPWSVSTPAQAAGVAALKETAYVEKSRRLIRIERAFLINELEARGMKVYGSEANSVFFRAQSQTLMEQLKAQGILIRSCGNYRGLDARYYRIAVRTHDENRQLISAMDKLKGGN